MKLVIIHHVIQKLKYKHNKKLLQNTDKINQEVILN